jgi:hypothetical protein
MMIAAPLTDALAKRLQWLDGEAYIAREILNNVEKGKRADNKNPVPVRKTLWQDHGVKLVSQLEKQGHVAVANALVDALRRYPVTAPTGFYPPDELRDERRTIVNLQALLTGVELQGDQGKLTEPDAPKNKTVERAKWLATAMLLVQEHPDWSDAKIAREVGKHPSTLSRHKIYQVAAAMARGDKSDRRRGHIIVDPDSGQLDVEAHSENGDPAKMEWDD